MSSIETIEDLREHLQGAMKLEHATVPTYLTALFSIKDGHNQEAATIIRSVVMEEMLHMTLVGNVLNAIGGTPKIDDADFVPTFPGYLPYSDKSFQVGLLPFSPEALKLFMRIELPEPADDPAQEAFTFHTIGELYRVLIEALKRLEEQANAKKETIFTGRPERQIGPKHYYYGGGGRVMTVTDLPSAVAALNEVTEQGEGRERSIFDGDHVRYGQPEEPAHYFRFKEVLCERYYARTDTPADAPSGDALPVDWSAIWPVAPNPRMARYEQHRPDVYALMRRFNLEYRKLLQQLDQAFNGHPDAMLAAVPTMYELKYQGVALMKIPNRNGTTTVGPSWEYVTD